MNTNKPVADRQAAITREIVRRTSFLQLVRSELFRITSRPMAIVSLVALLCVPLLYGGVYLWANKDPQGSLETVPAAIVVEDEGSKVDDEFHNFGAEVADELEADKMLDWHRVDAATAAQGVDDGTYYFALTFPKTFTSQLTSGATTAPNQASFILTTNDANSYLGTSIANTVTEKIVASMSKKIGEEAASKMLFGLNSAHDGFAQAADGAGQLRDSLQKAVDGAGQLADGAQKLHDDGTAALRSATADLPAQSAALNDGAQQLHSGASDLAVGAQSASDGAGQLVAGVDQLVEGAQQVADGNAQLAQKADELGAGLHTLVDGREAFVDDVVAELEANGASAETIEQVRASVRGAYDQNVAPIVTEKLSAVDSKISDIDLLANGAQQVATGLVSLQDGANALASGTTQLADGSAKLRDGASQLSNGTQQLADAAPTLVDGVEQLDDNASLLATKMRELASGLPQAVEGAGKLHDKLAEGADKLPAASEALRTDQAHTIADPIAADNEAMTKANGYGEGVAPMFLALAAWLGVFTLFMVIWPYSKRAITAMRHPFPVTLAGWLTPAILGTLEMTALIFLVTGPVGLHFEWTAATWAVMVVSSISFAALFQALRTWLDSAGQFVGLLLMVLQLSAAGGTFPWQTLPGPLAAIHHAMPMGWAIDALRQTMYGGDPAIVWRSIGMLVTLGLCSFGATLIALLIKANARTLRDLREPIIH